MAELEEYTDGLYCFFSTQLLRQLRKSRSNSDHQRYQSLIQNNKFHVRQFKFANPKYYVPEKFDAFNFTLPKLFDYLDHISKKISVNWAAKYMS